MYTCGCILKYLTLKVFFHAEDSLQRGKLNYLPYMPYLQGSGGDEILGCAWDGMTYIVDQQRNVVKYHVGESVCTFCAGECCCSVAHQFLG